MWHFLQFEPMSLVYEIYTKSRLHSEQVHVPPPSISLILVKCRRIR
jgi:hypothetical protein